MNEITNEYDALVMAMALAVNTTLQRGDAGELGRGLKIADIAFRDHADELAAGLDAETVERAKDEAIIKAVEILRHNRVLHRGDEPTGSA